MRKKFSIVFATSNIHKLYEVRSILKNYPIAIEQRKVKGLEIQSEDLKEIAEASALSAVKMVGAPTFVEDAGLFVDALKGFPGAFSSYVYKTIGNKGILKLLDGEENRRAAFKSVVAYCRPGEEPKSFLGEVRGKISLRERGSHGFGFDPIFEPDGFGGKTFGEIEVEEKNNCSHRALAVRMFAEWLKRHEFD